MRITIQELRSQKMALLVWSLSIGLLIAACVMMYPDMKSQMEGVNKMFSSMGNFTAAFGMDELNFGSMMGFYAIEGGNVLGIGGALFAALTATSSLMKEERDKTSEFLFTHPVSRVRVITEKLVSVVLIILVLNAIVLALSYGSVLAIGEEVEMKELLLLHLAYLLMQLEIAGICFGISAFIKNGGLGIGIGIAGFMYILNIVSNISDDAKPLKYITAFSYTEASDIIKTGKLDTGYLIPGMILMVVGIAVGYIRYSRKDLS